MTDEQINNQAASYSKTIMFFFFATYLYTVFKVPLGEGGGLLTPLGPLGPIVYIIIGIFVFSMLIGMPFFYIAKNFSNGILAEHLIKLVGIMVTIVVTRYITMAMF